MGKSYNEIKHLYVCSNFGEYADGIDSECVGWSNGNPNVDSLFTSYRKAYRYMQRVNKAYGFDRCSVEKLSSQEWQGWVWHELCRRAIENENK